MADKLVPSPDDTGAIRRFRDMGDGTWAEVVAMSGASLRNNAVAPCGGGNPSGLKASACFM